MTTRTAFIIHSLDDALAAAAAASELNTPVALISAPHALGYAGGLYLLSLFAKVHEAYPQTDILCILDCADMGAEAVSAMQMGHKNIISSAGPEMLVKLSDIARQLGVVIHTQQSATDLLRNRNAFLTCKKILSGLE